MNTKTIKLILCLTILIFLLSCSNDNGKENIIIFSTTSLRNPLVKICNNYQAETKNKIECIFDSSGRLRQQIQNDDYADIYISSSINDMNILKDIERLHNDTIINLFSNKIVLVMPKDLNININSFLDLTNDSVKKIAIGESMTSSIGRYTEDILNNLGIYNKIADKFILGKDAKEIIDLIKNDKIDCGIVYKTEAVLNDNDLKIVDEAEDYTDVVYSLAVLKNSSKEKISREFVEYLCLEKSLNIFKEYGFNIIK
ncbi:molybdate ABC transporter substrate-binding protein [Brachyspira alvinipulli]|uniref:molybdate ABC transporter substrate-binding protein n=1 Tax=Brachyspira alvinipulli TaxID=84379 RepID=UPI0004BBAE40|nr:molybdate ABC transporter substrate-binding protein [Brachyspira alvinipulli]